MVTGKHPTRARDVEGAQQALVSPLIGPRPSGSTRGSRGVHYVPLSHSGSPCSDQLATGIPVRSSEAGSSGASFQPTGISTEGV